jgi:SPP1 family predicted phage head-tail adaptor
MEAGKLRHRLSIFTPTESADGRGGFTRTWTDSDEKAWCSIEPMSSAETFFAGQVRAGLTHKITTRYTATITPDAQLRLGTRRFEVAGVRNVEERNRKLELVCKEIQD